MSKKTATEFEKIIHADRKRKEKQALAAKIFNRDTDRRSSAPANGLKAAGSLASRAGVTKQRSVSSFGTRVTRSTAGNINGAWTHDLHSPASGAGSLASRITKPGAAKAPKTIPTGPKSMQQQKRAAILGSAIVRDQLKPVADRQANVHVSGGKGITIRGLAGPPVVMAQNFAPGTTAADIESAVTPVGGIVTSCRLLKTNPIIIAEIVFDDANGAQRVIDTFNNQTADGRLLHVYYKVGGGSSPTPAAAATTGQNGASANANGNIVDGSFGFYDNGASKAADNSQGRSKLYSDSLLPNKGNINGKRGGGRGRNAGR